VHPSCVSTERTHLGVLYTNSLMKNHENCQHYALTSPIVPKRNKKDFMQTMYRVHTLHVGLHKQQTTYWNNFMSVHGRPQVWARGH